VAYTLPTAVARTALTSKFGEWVAVASFDRTRISRFGQRELDTAESGQEARRLRIRVDLVD